MTIQTRDFGSVELAEEDIIEFCQPMYGFESLTKYVLLRDDELGQHIAWLQSVEEPGLCFIVVDPDILPMEYFPTIAEPVIRMLGDEDYVCWCVATIADRFDRSTVNLKSPILINPSRHCAAQVILEDDYPIRQPLSGKKEAKS